MKSQRWRELYLDLADRYFEATGELVPTPIDPDTGKRLHDILLSDRTLANLYWDSGLTIEQIAKLVGAGKRTINVRMQKAGIKARRRQDYPATDRQREVSRQNMQAYNAAHPREKRERTPAGPTTSERRRGAGYEFGGSEHKTAKGYIVVYAPEHPRANKAGVVPKHTLVMERELGRYVTDDEVVHHINHVRDDNRPENLEVLPKMYHRRMHGKEGGAARNLKLGLDPKPKFYGPPKPPRDKLDKDKLRELYEQGCTDAEIGRQLHRSPATICSARSRLHLKANPRPYKRIVDDVAMAMYKAGASNREIAEKFGVKKHTVSAWKKTMGLPPGANACSKQSIQQEMVGVG